LLGDAGTFGHHNRSLPAIISVLHDPGGDTVVAGIVHRFRQ
jgi:hypothetical protein